MSLKRKQILDAIGRTNPIFHKIAEGHSEDEENNVFEGAFRASNAIVEREIKEKTKYDLTLVEMTDMETFDFSQFDNGDIRSSVLHRSLSRVFDISNPNITSPSNSFDSTTPSLLPSNTTSDFGSSSRIATHRLYTGKDTGTEGFQNVPGGHQHHGESDLSKGPRLLYPKPRETESFPSPPFTVNQQTASPTFTNAQLAILFSPANLISATELLGVVPILDDPGQQTPTPRRKRKNALNVGRIERPPAKGRRMRKVKVQTKEEEATKREKFLDRNRRAAQKCRQNKKTWVRDLLERAEFFATNKAKQPYKIELIKLELEGLKAIAVEHYRVCPNPSPELSTWFEKEVVRLQQGKAAASIHYADGPLSPHDTDCTDQVDADVSPLMDLGSFCQGSDSSAPMTP
jgi:hypothetical protein